MTLISDDKKERIRGHWRNFKWSVRDKAIDAASWALEHPLITVMGVSTVTSLIKTGVKAKQHRDKQLRVYDHATDSYCKLKRPLSNNDLRQINEHRENGESFIRALEELDLLK